MKSEEDLINANFDVRYSGTTCVTVQLTGHKIICANSGDSRAILCCNDGKKWKVVPLSRDHKPEIPEEKERIESMNGRVDPFRSK